jgi:hypothetical protein
MLNPLTPSSKVMDEKPTEAPDATVGTSEPAPTPVEELESKLSDDFSMKPDSCFSEGSEFRLPTLFCLAEKLLSGKNSEAPDAEEAAEEDDDEEDVDEAELLKKLLFRSMEGGEFFEKIYDTFKDHLLPPEEKIELVRPNFLESLGEYLLRQGAMMGGELFERQELFERIEKTLAAPLPSPAPNSAPTPKTPVAK